MTDTELTSTSTEVLEHECTTLAAQIASATCRFLLVIAELDRREAWGQWWGVKSMVHWLSWRCSLSEATARDHLRVARALPSLPLTTAAFSRGELSYSKVRALVRVAAPESEAELVELARTATAAQLERIIRARLTATADPAKRDALRELHSGWDDEGMATVQARMRGDERELFDAAIGAALPEADVSAETPVAARRVDALMRICESYLAHGDAARPGTHRHSVVLHVGLDDAGGVVDAETEAGLPVHPSTAQRVMCDSTLSTIVHGRLEPLGGGRTTYEPSRAMRRAIHRRSGGRCEWVGCTERRYIEIHHLLPWEQGGPTEWWNLAALCWHHHHLVHGRGFRIELDRTTGELRCSRPDGTELLDPTPTSAPPLDVDVDREAVVPLWTGERFDLPACVDAVLATTS